MRLTAHNVAHAVFERHCLLGASPLNQRTNRRMAGGTSDYFVGVAPDGSGKSIRTRQAYVMLDDGTFQLMEVQVVGLVDSDGRDVKLNQQDVLEEILTELREIKEFMQLHLG